MLSRWKKHSLVAPDWREFIDSLSRREGQFLAETRPSGWKMSILEHENYRFSLHVRCGLFRISVCRTAPDSYANTKSGANSCDSWDSWK
jgi:hypothetical protein